MHPYIGNLTGFWLVLEEVLGHGQKHLFSKHTCQDEIAVVGGYAGTTWNIYSVFAPEGGQGINPGEDHKNKALPNPLKC